VTCNGLTAETVAELDPRTTSALQVVTLGMLGFRAMSLGVQDFAQPVQDAIHRHQSRAQTAWLIQQGREHGFTDINLDIVYGLPRQTEHSFAATLDTVVELQPDRIAMFATRISRASCRIRRSSNAPAGCSTRTSAPRYCYSRSSG
jgi:oxygen-independent coproporphyrinogen-3 oxidase